MHDEGRTSVKNECEDTEDFTVKVGDHERSALSQYLFSLVIEEELARDVQDELP